MTSTASRSWRSARIRRGATAPPESLPTTSTGISPACQCGRSVTPSDTGPGNLRREIGGGSWRRRPSLVLLIGFVANLIWQNHRVGQARDRAQAERLAAENLVGMLTDLFQQSNPEVVPGGDTLRVGAFLDRAEQGIGQLDEPERQAQMRRVLGNVWAARGSARARGGAAAHSRSRISTAWRDRRTP